MRILPRPLTTLVTKFRYSRKKPRTQSSIGYDRKLHVEQFEDRRMLANFTVTNPNDGVVNSPGDQPGTLRQAIFDARVTLETDDTIDFAASLDGDTIALTAGELFIDDSVTIDASMLSSLTIDAGNGADDTFGTGDGTNVFFILLDPSNDGVQEVTLDGLTITGGDSGGGDVGGGISFVGDSRAANSQTKLSILNSTITGNHTQGFFAYGSGGGLYARLYGNNSSEPGLVIQNTIISSNSSTSTARPAGGGELAVIADKAKIDISDTTISGNDSATKGGGYFRLSESTVDVTRSTITGNNATRIPCNLSLAA